MKKEHLSETMIQLYVLDRTACDTVILEHMNTCEHCKREAANYQAMFVSIKQLPQPSFDFDLSELVIPQIQKQKPGGSWSVFLVVLGSLLVMAIPAYFIQDYLKDLIAGMSQVVIYLIVITILMIMSFQIMETFRRYRQQIINLDF